MGAVQIKEVRPAVTRGGGPWRRLFSQEGPTAVVLLLPSLIVVFGIIIYPLLKTLYTSFFAVDSAFPGHYPFVGLGNYAHVLRTGEFWDAVGHTAYFTVLTTFLEVFFGLLIGLLLNTDLKGRWLFRSIVILPWALPTIVNGAMWRWIFNADYGALNALLTQLHIIPHYRAWLGDPWTALNMVAVADIWKNTPLAAFFILAALQTIPGDLCEAARVDGAGRLRSFFSITLPLLMPTIVIILVLRTMEAFKVFDIIYVMTGGGPANGTETVAYYTYVEAFSNQLFGEGAALAYIIAIFILFFAIIYMRMLQRGEVEY